MKKLLILCFLLLSTFLSAQLECSTESTGEDFLKNYNSSNASLDGPLYVQLYLHVVREDDGTGGVTQSDIDDGIDLLYEKFAEHHIFLNICVDEIKYSPGLKDSDLFRELYASDPTDGINVYYVPVDGNNIQIQNGVAGRAQVPGQHCWSSTGNGYISLVHEVGHCMGLYHTWHGTSTCRDGDLPDNCLVDCDPVICSPDCKNEGDFICDTPPDGGSNSCYDFDCNLGTLNFNFDDWCGNTFDDPDGYLRTNIMARSVMCRDQFSPDQAIRMCETLQSHPEMMKTLIDDLVGCDEPSNFCDETIIEDTDILNTTIDYNSNLRIADGAHLTVTTSTLSFARGKGIIIEEGGRITLNNAILTNNDLSPCDNYEPGNAFWKGMVFEFPSPQINISGTLIENAEIAIHFKNDAWLTVIENCTFLNNATAVQRSNCGGQFFMDDSEIILDENYLEPIFGSQVFLFNSIYNRFRRCTFSQNKDIDVFIDAFGFGMRSFNSQVILIENTFENWAVAASQRNALSMPLVCYKNEFYNNATGIQNNLSTCFARRNEFVVDYEYYDGVQSLTATGIKVLNFSDYVIRENILDAAPEVVGVPFRTNAINLDKTGSTNNTILNNSLDGFKQGMLIENDNGDDGAGVRMTCNYMENSLDEDIWIRGLSTATIFPQQGNPNVPAGNLFTQNCSGELNFRHNGPQDLLYYYNVNNPLEFPNCTNLNDDDLIDLFSPNNDCSDPRNGFTSDNPKTITELEALYQSIQTDILNIENVITGLDPTTQAFTDAQSELLDLFNEEEFVINEAIESSLLAETPSVNLTSDLQFWLFRKRGKLAAYQYMEFLLATSALEALETELINHDAVAYRAEDQSHKPIKAYQSLTEMLIQVKREGRDESLLNSNELDLLCAVASADVGFGSEKAKGILEVFYPDLSINCLTEEGSKTEDEGVFTDSKTSFIYPNPNAGTFNIQLPNAYKNDQILSFSVYDINGKKIWKKLNPRHQDSILLSNLESGVYIVTLDFNSGVSMTQKMIIK